MNEEKAREILKPYIKPNNALSGNGPKTYPRSYISWSPHETATLIGGYQSSFTVDQLKAIVWWMENMGEK